VPEDRSDLIYGTTMQYTCACGKEYKHQIDLKEHITKRGEGHADSSYRRARTKAEWEREQRDFSSLHLRIGKPPKRRNQ